MSDKLVTIAKFDQLFEAHLAKQRLADFGIASAVIGQNFAAVFPVSGIGRVELQVTADCAAEAVKLLKSQAGGQEGENLLG